MNHIIQQIIFKRGICVPCTNFVNTIASSFFHEVVCILSGCVSILFSVAGTAEQGEGTRGHVTPPPPPIFLKL